MKISVLIVDDSQLTRQLVREVLCSQDDLEVVGEAADPLQARELILSKRPDVLTLDVEMPGVNGLSFLKRMMSVRPMPVVILSAFAQSGGVVEERALRMGAVACVRKPVAAEIVDGSYHALLADAIRRAHRARHSLDLAELHRQSDAAEIMQVQTSGQQDMLVVGVSGSVGCADTLKVLIPSLRPMDASVVVALDAQRGVLAHLVGRLADVSAYPVGFANDNERLEKGRVYFAPHSSHIRLERSDDGSLVLRLDGDSPVHGRQPSSDVLFHSISTSAGANSLGVLLSGTGVDGVSGLMSLKMVGARTIAQSAEECIAPDGPRMAYELGAAAMSLKTHDIAVEVNK